MWVERLTRVTTAAAIAARLFVGTLTVAATCLGSAHAIDGRYGLGRAAKPAEISAWDIDVRPDFAGLPKGSGSVERGQEIWEAKCASCHGVFGESNEVFNPIIGGTTADDVKTGRVKSLTTSQLQRTTMMKLSSLSTIWDYIRRAMPWNEPKSLSVDDVYAVTAYILSLADLVPSGFVLSDANIRTTEQLLPNRNGMTQTHGMWEVRGKPDVRNVACMKNCETMQIQSSMPDYARNAHGNLAEQNRLVGAVRGVDTTRTVVASASGVEEGRVGAADFAAQTGGVAVKSASPKSGSSADPHPMLALANRQGCMACHALDRKLVGPSFRDVAAKLGSTSATSAAGAIAAGLASKIRAGGSGGWGAIPMPPQPQLSTADAGALAAWIVDGAKLR